MMHLRLRAMISDVQAAVPHQRRQALTVVRRMTPARSRGNAAVGSPDKGGIAMTIWVFRAAALVITGCSVVFGPAWAAVPEYSAVVVKTYPHDPKAFTEGLLYQGGFLYQSTGRNGQSSIRKVELDTGKVVQQHELDPKYFGEGIVIWQNRLVGLTYKTEIGFVFDRGSLNEVSDFHYKGEGWGMTRDDFPPVHE